MNPDSLPEGWTWSKLGDLGRYLNGRAFKSGLWGREGRLIVRIQNLTGSRAEENFYSGPVEPRHEVNPGDFLISWAATLDAYIWQRPPAVLNQHIFKVESFIDKKFHFYLVKDALAELYRRSHGSGMVHVTKGPFDATPVRLPPLAEQRRIVDAIEAYFTRLDAAMAALERVRTQLKRYRASVLGAACSESLVGEDASTWTLTSIGEHATLVQYGTSSKTSEGPEGIPVLRMGNLKDGKLILDDLKFLPSGHEEFPALFLQPGDLLFNRTNSPELVGKTAVYRGSPSPCSFASYLVRVRFDAGLLPDFVSYFTNGPPGRAWVKSVVSQQVGQANVNSSKFKGLQLRIPPIGVQRAIVAEVERRLSVADALAAEVDAALAKCARMRQAILKKAFEGRLVPQDPHDEPAGVMLERLKSSQLVSHASSKSRPTRRKVS